MTDSANIDFDIQKVMEYLPHRYPFLLIDRVLECSAGEHLTALKNVTVNEPFFQGHFPKQPIMPGVLIMEALAQATGLLSFCSMDADHKNKLYMLVGIDKARFRGQVIPGDQLILTVNLKRNMRGIWMFEGSAKVDGEVIAEADLMCSAQDKK
ncbi:MAG: 3-hydroxyacyl-ACP dehydratase FabZ [Gammaproteobacteria bacterium]|nr:3-hydroxyacyl-ACP dehydratase FabZ [Gammaproteobacteria bacterium]